MEKKEYNICFELGDESHDGHERSEKFHMISNYSAKEITKFLNEFEKKTGVDICKECEDYEDNTFSKETTKKLLELGIIDSEYVEGDGCYYVDGTDDFIDIIENCLKYVVKDFEWHYRNLKEEKLYKLDGVGYGLFWD